MVMLSLLLACSAIIGPSAVESLSYSTNTITGRRSSNNIGAAIPTPKLQWGLHSHHNYHVAYSSHSHDTLPLSSSPSSTALHMALGGNYLNDIDNNENDSPPGGSDANTNNSNDRWGFFGGGRSSNAKPRGSNRDGGMNGGGNTNGNNANGNGNAIRPSPPNNGAPNSNNQDYNIGGNRGQQQQRRGGVPKVFSIRQPQDLLDFVIQDERLSVVKVYASWCKTCAVFDIRYRKLASQLGDTHTSTKSDSKLVSSGRARFAEMQFDDPNNEEMCRLLNATKLPYILIYKGSKGKVADFQCGPAKFQMLLDAVNEYADAEGSVAGVGDSTAAGGNVGGEQEWNVVREQQQKQQQATRYGGANSIVNYPSSDDASKLQQKEAEITRLYTELSALRTDFDRRIVLLKETNSKETSTLNERIRAQTTEFENERRALSKQIEELSREMMDREKSLRANENAGNEQLQGEMKQKEEDYKMTLTGLNLRIGELQQDLFKSRNELQYNSNASSNDQLQLREHISNVETEMTNLKSRNQELERELIEEKRMVVASTEEASRVLKQLERIKSNEDEERKVLAARIVELEGQIEERERQLLIATTNNNNNNNGGEQLAREIQQELDQLKEEYGRERTLMTARITELEQELTYWQSTSSNNNDDLMSQRQQQQQLQKETETLSSRILELENEIDDRDRLLRTSNKATDILLDNMEAQKREYELELERTSSLVGELEEAIQGREGEMAMLQERMAGLERQIRMEAASSAGVGVPANIFAQQQQASGGMDGSLDQERQARIAAEQEVGKLMGSLKNREEEITRMQQQQQQPGGGGSGMEAPGWFGDFGALFNGGNGGGGNANAESNTADNNNSWESPWEGAMNNEESDMEGYEMLKDVLMPEEPMMPQSGAGRSENIWEGASPPAGQSDNIWEGAGLSSLMSTPDESASGVGRPENIREGAGSAFYSSSRQTPSSANTPSPAAYAAPAELPSPAMAFERRLAENPIVPAGTFGGSKPTASFFSPKSSQGAAAAAPSDTPEYYQNAMSNFNNDREGRGEAPAASPFEQRQMEHQNVMSNFNNNGGEAPAMPPSASFEQRPTAPAPRGQAARSSENIYAGAGSFGAGTAGRASTPTPTPEPEVRWEAPAAAQPHAAQEFERRLAENPIVPAGTFGGSRPTSHFFSPKSAPPASTGAPPSAPAAGRGATSFGAAAGRDNSPPQQSQFPSEDESEGDPQSKWQRLNDNEKKRVAAEAYKAFENSLDDRRGTQSKMKGGSTMGRGGGGLGGASAGRGGGGSGAAGATKRPTIAAKTTTTAAKTTTTAGTKQKSSQMELERKKHQDMVKSAAAPDAAAKKQQTGAPRTTSAAAPKAPIKKNAPQQQQSAQQIQASAVQASAKRMSLAERAAKTDQDRKDREKRQKAEARKSQEDKQLEKLQGAAELKRNEEIQRAEELKRKAAADLALAAEAKAKADAEAANQQRLADEEKKAKEEDEVAERQGRSTESVDRAEIIEAALLGAEESEEQEERSYKVPTKPPKSDQTTASSKRQLKKKAKTQKVAVVAGSGFAVSKKYDVMVLDNPKDIDMPQLLEGSLKDLLKEKGQPPKRNSGDNNY